MKIKEKLAKTIITKSKLPDVDYVINPYTGCEFACKYCYASFMSKFIGEDIKDWGNFVYVKTNAIELIEKEILKINKINPNAKILLSSVTDAWQGIESKYKLTRGILSVLIKNDFQGTLSCLTKSPLIERDIGLLKQFKNHHIGMTITSTEDKVSRFLETNAPDVSRRLKTLKKLNAAGLKTYAFVGPIFPHFVNDLNSLDDLFKAIKKTGTNDVYVEHLNLSSSVLMRMIPFLKTCDKDIYDLYTQKSKSPEYRKILNEAIMKIIAKYKINLMLGKIIEH